MKPEACAACECQAPEGIGRRTLLAAAAGLAALLPGERARADDDPAAAKPPQEGDLLVQAGGMTGGAPVTMDLFTQPNTVVQAWPKDPASGVVRKGSRLNRVLLVRIDPATMDASTKKRALNGVVAYSDFCTHAGCFIETYHAQDNVILCHCHGSMFDPRNDGAVTGGPARAPLAGLPLKLVGTQLAAAGPFIGKLGIPPE